jgi:hypothetical protein
MPANRHPGITMHKISFGGGFMGLVFAAGSALIFVIGFPTLWYFVAFAFALGIGIAILLRAVNRKISQRNRPLSILAVSEAKGSAEAPARMKWRRSFKVLPGLTSA